MSITESSETVVAPELQEVIVKDINMSFVSMVFFMVKWVLASIPSFIILFALGFILAGVFGVLL